MSEALHTAARRYCIEQFACWAEVYTRFPYAGGPYSDGALGVFPRYQQLEAIQLAVERFIPADLGALGDARAKLIASEPSPCGSQAGPQRSADAREWTRASLPAHLYATTRRASQRSECPGARAEHR